MTICANSSHPANSNAHGECAWCLLGKAEAKVKELAEQLDCLRTEGGNAVEQHLLTENKQLRESIKAYCEQLADIDDIKAEQALKKGE